MPYAVENKISKSPIDDGIEITDQQYRDALAAMGEGKKIAVRSGELRILSRDKRTVWSLTDGSKLEIAENDDTPDGYTEDGPPSPDHVMEAGKWVEKPAPVPDEVTRLQIMRELRNRGLAAAFKKALAAADEDTREDWELAVSVRRDDPMAAAFGRALELGEDGLDDLWRESARR